MQDRNAIVIKNVPANQKDDFSAFLAGPTEAVNPLDEASDHVWLFEVEGIWKNGARRFFIWQIVGSIDDSKDVRQRLAEKAAFFGIRRLWIYAVHKPCAPEMLEYIKELNRTRSWMEAA